MFFNIRLSDPKDIFIDYCEQVAENLSEDFIEVYEDFTYSQEFNIICERYQYYNNPEKVARIIERWFKIFGNEAV